MAVKSDKSAISIKVTEITSTKTRIKIIADVIRMKFIANRKGLTLNLATPKIYSSLQGSS